MLDKSVPYLNLIMKAKKELIYPIPPPPLPPGFSYRRYAPGDMIRWAEIETSVGEFPGEAEAVAYFREKYLPFEEQMKERLCFIVDDDGIYCATAMTWYFNGKNGKHWAALNWVATKPGYQGKGLGRAVVEKALSQFRELEPGLDVYLHTQTWSHQAVGMYLRMGFRVQKTECFAHYTNDYDAVVTALKGTMEQQSYKQMCETAE